MRSNEGSAKAPAKRTPAEPFDRLRRRLAHADDGWLFASIAAQVTERRLALGLSQVELAKLCNTSQSAIARLEAGGRPPRIDTLLRLAEALDCDLAVELRPRGSSTSTGTDRRT
jgi:ribosome-binding protein aMBF1 (putative translation factor)